MISSLNALLFQHKRIMQIEDMIFNDNTNEIKKNNVYIQVEVEVEISND